MPPTRRLSTDVLGPSSWWTTSTATTSPVAGRPARRSRAVSARAWFALVHISPPSATTTSIARAVAVSAHHGQSRSSRCHTASGTRAHSQENTALTRSHNRAPGPSTSACRAFPSARPPGGLPALTAALG
ncbi:hypothetical protein [Saccharothrix sp. HUAS TT1]|uniref:hypothetical protein n=1 Tax=unclassified Saccharothrix TaxID=2593673 RepID=UPI00345BB3E1